MNIRDPLIYPRHCERGLVLECKGDEVCVGVVGLGTADHPHTRLCRVGGVAQVDRAALFSSRASLILTQLYSLLARINIIASSSLFLIIFMLGTLSFMIVIFLTFPTIFFNIIEKVKLEIYKPHHVSLFIFNSFSNLPSNILNNCKLHEEL